MLDLEDPTEYIGELLWIRPYSGWGWAHYVEGNKVPVDYSVIDAAGPFQIRIDQFFVSHRQVRGVLAQVAQPGHLFHGLYVVGATMVVGEWNFTDKLCWRYDMEIGSTPPQLGEWPRIVEGRSIWRGHGIIAESLEWIQIADANR
jgi:hypothetical protein